MTLNQLTYFYHAATLQHFNQAAEKSNISEPSLSRAIASLEDELDVILFEKKGRNVQLTKAGHVLFEHVTTILDDVNRADARMRQLSAGGGVIDIASVSPLARTYIPRTIRAFLDKEENRNIMFSFHQDMSAPNIDGLKKGSYDLIFGSADFNEVGIKFVPIMQQEMVVILPKNHQLAEKSALTSEIFSLYPVLGYERTSGLGQYTRDFFAKNHLSIDFICESPDEVGIAALVAEGFGIALVADVESIHLDNVIIRPLVPEERFFHTVYMGYMRDQYQLPAVRRLISFVQRQHASNTQRFQVIN
jgi:DNA-binding transcriptional LysR family regulator